MLYKTRDFLNKFILKLIWFVLFDSHTSHSFYNLGAKHQNCKLPPLTRERPAHTNPFFQSSNILKLPDIIKIDNCLLISIYVHNKLPSIFNKWLTFSSKIHRYESSSATKGHLKFQVLEKFLLEKIPSLTWLSKHGMIFKK